MPLWEAFWECPYNRHVFVFLIVAVLSACVAKYWWWLAALLLLAWLGSETLVVWKDLWPGVRKLISLLSSCAALLRFLRDEYRYPLVFLVLLTGLVQLVEQFGWFQHLEATFFDSFSRKNNHTMSTPILIVEITEDDYDSLFGGKSPLEPWPVLELIRVIREGCPAVIGVDLDTRYERWANADQLWQTKGEDQMNPCGEALPVPNFFGKDGKNPNPYAEALKADNVIWAEVPYEMSVSEGPPKLELDCVLGGKPTGEKAPPPIGIVRFPQDEDGFVRRHYGVYEVGGSLSHPCLTQKTKESLPPTGKQKEENRCTDETPHCYPAFDRAIAKKWWDAVKNSWPHTSNWQPKPDRKAPADWEYIGFSSDHNSLQILHASDFIKLNENCTPIQANQVPPNALKGKIVLIGGSFAAARDNYMTPLREMAGVELIANAIDSDLKPPIRDVNLAFLLLFDMVAGTWIVLIYYMWRESPGIALVVSLLSIVVPPLVLAAFAFYWLGTWLNVAPVMAGMVIHQMLESAHPHHNP